jgi:hypothetical protein
MCCVCWSGVAGRSRDAGAATPLSKKDLQALRVRWRSTVTEHSEFRTGNQQWVECDIGIWDCFDHQYQEVRQDLLLVARATQVNSPSLCAKNHYSTDMQCAILLPREVIFVRISTQNVLMANFSTKHWYTSQHGTGSFVDLWALVEDRRSSSDELGCESRYRKYCSGDGWHTRDLVLVLCYPADALMWDRWFAWNMWMWEPALYRGRWSYYSYYSLRVVIQSWLVAGQSCSLECLSDSSSGLLMVQACGLQRQR